MKRLFNFKYPKILAWIIVIILAYLVFRNHSISGFVSNLGTWGYIGIFIAGIFFTFGFTAPFAIGFFVSLSPEHLIFSAILGGFGALLGNLFIFHFIRFSFLDEFILLEHTETMREISFLIENNLGHRIKIYLIYLFAGLIIASPLPDEIADTMLAGLTKIRPFFFSIICFAFSTLGIGVLLFI